MSFILKWFRVEHKDMSEHRVYTTNYEDLCM